MTAKDTLLPPDPVAALEQLLAALDAAPADASQPILKKADDKEHYETRLMFALRRRNAARYHQGNVARLLTEQTAAANAHFAALAGEFADSTDLKFLKPVASQMKSSTSSEEFVHEVSAFLAAIRSGLDFIAMTAGRAIPGVSAHSVNTLMGMAAKKAGHPVLAVVAKHSGWLADLKAYRDEVVHRLVICAPTAGWVISHKGKTSTVILPVVIPAATPKLAHDTRWSRMMEEDPPLGLIRREMTGSVTWPDGTHEVRDHTVTYEVSPGYMTVQDFMQHHLAHYDGFLADMFSVLRELAFAQVKS